MASTNPHPDYVTQRELDARLEGQAEMRTMVAKQIEQLAKGQGDLSQQLYAMEREIVGQLRIANGRTGKLEDRLEKAEELLENGKAHIADFEATVHKIFEDGCQQKDKHPLIRVVPLDEVRREDDGPPDDAPLVERGRARKMVRAHGPKVAVGGGLVALGVILQHLPALVEWFVHTVLGIPQ